MVHAEGAFFSARVCGLCVWCGMLVVVYCIVKIDIQVQIWRHIGGTLEFHIGVTLEVQWSYIGGTLELRWGRSRPEAVLFSPEKGGRELGRVVWASHCFAQLLVAGCLELVVVSWYASG